jgi:hypothetical protein
MAAFPASGRPPTQRSAAEGQPPSAPPPPAITSTARRPTSLPNGAATASILHRATPTSFLHARRHLLSPRLPPYVSPPARCRVSPNRFPQPARRRSHRPTSNRQRAAATHTPRRPFRTDLATAPAPPSSLSPASKGSTAAGLADALPSPASRAARRRQVHPLQVRGRHPRQFTREANGIPQGGGFLDLLPLSCPSPLPRGAHQRSARQFTRRLTRGVHRSLFPESTSVHVDCPGASTS